VKRRLIRLGFVALVASFFLLNVVAYFHAWRMTHFLSSGKRTVSPEKLSITGEMVTLLRGVDVPKPLVHPAGTEFPQPARTVRFVARDGVKLEAWDIPSAAPAVGVVVMFHGYAVSRSSLLGEARVLHDLGWRTVPVDFRGSGGSDGSVTTLGWREAEDVAAAASWAGREWPQSRLMLYGVSMGAVAVLRAMATENVRPRAVILECPFDMLLTTVRHRYRVMGLPAFPFAEFLVLWGGFQHGFNAFRLNPTDYASSVTCPALVLDGESDPFVRPAEARRVAAAMRGPTECHIFLDGGHGGYWRDMPEEYRKTVTDWLATVPTHQ
jgi:dipeptidyl aminopeptidase/acylaminoacyl peptidase